MEDKISASERQRVNEVLLTGRRSLLLHTDHVMAQKGLQRSGSNQLLPAPKN